MLRVIAGTVRSLKLVTPEGLDTRPTTDRIKETLFNMLQAEIPGAVIIDFFAGSGSIGIEALSRGAKRAYFVDNSREAVKCINENLAHTHFADASTVFPFEAIKAAYSVNEKHVDLVFMDPPYGKGLEKDLLRVLKDMSYIDDETLFVVESDLETEFSGPALTGFEVIKEKIYKTNKHVFLKKQGGAQ